MSSSSRHRLTLPLVIRQIEIIDSIMLVHTSVVHPEQGDGEHLIEAFAQGAGSVLHVGRRGRSGLQHPGVRPLTTHTINLSAEDLGPWQNADGSVTMVGWYEKLHNPFM
jgi:hypothetical protein